jgi:hypothetical protein
MPPASQSTITRKLPSYFPFTPECGNRAASFPIPLGTAFRSHQPSTDDGRSSSNAFASFRSRVSRPEPTARAPSAACRGRARGARGSSRRVVPRIDANEIILNRACKLGQTSHVVEDTAWRSKQSQHRAAIKRQRESLVDGEPARERQQTPHRLGRHERHWGRRTIPPRRRGSKPLPRA